MSSVQISCMSSLYTSSRCLKVRGCVRNSLLNGKNKKANRYIERAMPELRRALSYMSDAEFELYTWGPDEIDG